MKEYYSNITIRFGGNNLEANSEKEYIELIKEQFYESYRIDLVDSEIEIVEWDHAFITNKKEIK